jgi:hemoglobin
MGNHATIHVIERKRRTGRREPSADSIRGLLDRFYDRVRCDPHLGPLFNRAIPENCRSHLVTMHDFWTSLMLTSGRYKGTPVAVHLREDGTEPRFFTRWLMLFRDTCRELFPDFVADTYFAKAVCIAESLKLAVFYRSDRPWQEIAP